MRTRPTKNFKSYSWPRLVANKWLNIRSSSNDFFSHYNNQQNEGGGLERRKSFSDKDKSLLTTSKKKLGHGGWLRCSSEPDPHPTAATQNLRVFVGTWNVGGKAPSPHESLDLEDWLFSCSPQPADIYVLGFQEIVPLNAGNVLGAEDRGPASTWLTLIDRALNPQEQGPEVCGIYRDATDGEPGEFFPGDGGGVRGYRLTACKQMVGIFLCVWVREKHVRHVRDTKVSCVGTGIMGYMGNKGSVSISMTIRGSTFCFVCSHLSSGEKEGDEARRNSNVMEILRRTRFPRSRTSVISPATILQHDKIIWLGDLNYRLAASCSDTSRLIEEKDWQSLLERDQLGMEQREGRVLKGWEEGKISFPPTYKYLPNSNSYAYTAIKPGDKRRTPAWCDRILWRGEGIKQISYSRFESQFSDHRPVHSLFSIEIDNYNHLETGAGRRATITATANHSSISSLSCTRVQIEELLVITRSQSCLSTSRFYF